MAWHWKFGTQLAFLRGVVFVFGCVRNNACVHSSLQCIIMLATKAVKLLPTPLFVACKSLSCCTFRVLEHRAHDLSGFLGVCDTSNSAAVGVSGQLVSTTLSKNAQSFRRYCRVSTDGALPGLPSALSSSESGFSGTATVRMESQVIFNACWRKLEERHGLKNLHIPRDVVWLNGAPGAGKGVNTEHILKTRGLDHSFCMSQMLMTYVESRSVIDRGEMLSDNLVGDMLLDALLVKTCTSSECGVLVDGFPRTAVQVDFLKLLYDKLLELHNGYAKTDLADQFPRPSFKVVVLYVNEETSVERQLERAKVASIHNQRVVDAGAGQLWEQRVTDMSIEVCRKRYSIFRHHYSAILRLKQFFPFHLIDAMGTLAETREAITKELRYQSSLDLSEKTYSSIRHLPLARELVKSARQQLVMRLDSHCHRQPDTFYAVMDILTTEVVPLLQRGGLAGRAHFSTEAKIFSEQPRAVQMVIDVLSDRGYHVSHSSEFFFVPQRIDFNTGVIINRKDTRHNFHITWDTQSVRAMEKALEIAARFNEDTQSATTKPPVSEADKAARISHSFIPAHADLETRYAPRDPSHLLHINEDNSPQTRPSLSKQAFVG